MSSVQMIDDDDETWDAPLTALQVARYDAFLKEQREEAERERAAASARARMIFGECLRQLVVLGIPETKARPLLGKWRAAAKDDARLARMVKAAHDAGVPDPVSYITKAVSKSTTRQEQVDNRMQRRWTLLGWEMPRETDGGPRFQGARRGQVWLDAYGKAKVLPAPDETPIPTVKEDPGVDPRDVRTE